MVPQSTLVLAGRYRLISQLREGGMGKVWTAEHLSLSSQVAVKLLDDELSTRPDAVARFLREARAAAQIRSPHIVQVFDVGIDRGIPFLAMELLHGESLAERLERAGRLPASVTAHFLSHVARGIGRAHSAGLVHRDLKPSNIFLEKNEEEEVAKVLDFGVAKALLPGLDTESGATRTGTLIGSPHYMSPEQAEASAALDHRTDIWSYGVVAFECLVGRRPFDQLSLGSQLLAICAWPLPVPSRIAHVPTGFDAWFARACARPVGERFSSIQEASHELRRVCLGDKSLPISVSSIPSPPVVATPKSEESRVVHLLSSLAPREMAKHARKPKIAVAVVIAALFLVTLIWKLASRHDESALTAPESASVPAAPSRAPAATLVPVAPVPPVAIEKANAIDAATSPLAPAPVQTIKPTLPTARARPAVNAKPAIKAKRSTTGFKEDPY